MKKIIEFLNKQLELYKTNLENNNKEILKLDEIISILEKSIKNPDEINEEEFNKIFDIETIKDILFYKGWFKSNSTEPQIIDAYRLLKELVDNKITEISLKKEKLNNENTSYQELINNYEEIFQFLQGYNKDTYVPIEILDKINEIIFSIDIDDEIVKLFLDIAINNSIIEKSKIINHEEINEELTEEEIARMSNARQETTKVLEEKTPIKDEKKEILNKIDQFKHNEEYKKLDNELYSRTIDILDSFISLNVDNDDIQLVELFDLDECVGNGKEHFIIKTCIELLKGFETGNIEKIKEVLNIFDTSARENNDESTQSIDLVELLKLNGLEDLVETLVSVNNKYNIMEYIKNNDKFIKAMDGFDEEQKNQYLIGKNADEKTIISLALEYKNIYELIEDGTIDEEIKEMLVEIHNKIKSIIKIKNGDNIKKTPTLEDDNPNDIVKPYSNEDFENYVVILNEDKFIKSYKDAEERTEGSTKSYFAGLFIRKLNTLIDTPENELIHSGNSHIVNISQNKSNEFGIFDLILGGKTIRLTYKMLPNVSLASDSLKKHGVIMILNTCYARTNKANELLDSINIFTSERGQKRFKELERIFGDANNQDEQQAEIDKSRKLFDEIYKKIDKKSIGMGAK